MSSAPVALRSNYPALFGAGALPVLEELFMNDYESVPPIRDQLFAVRSTDRDIWQASELNDLPAFDLIPEGSEYTYRKPAPGYNVTLSVQKYGGGFAISRELMEDARWDLISQMTRKLGRSGRETQEITAMNVFNNAFSTSLSEDGVSLVNGAHTINGLSYSNVITGNPDLSESSLQAALAQFDGAFINGTGFINRIRPAILVVSKENRRYAHELVDSDLKADTANNNINSIRTVDGGIRVVSSPYLTDPDAWFLMGEPEDTGLRIIERQALRTEASGRDVGFHTDSMFFKASYREVIGVTRAQGILGSQGS